MCINNKWIMSITKNLLYLCATSYAPIKSSKSMSMSPTFDLASFCMILTYLSYLGILSSLMYMFQLPSKLISIMPSTLSRLMGTDEIKSMINHDLIQLMQTTSMSVISYPFTSSSIVMKFIMMSTKKHHSKNKLSV